MLQACDEVCGKKKVEGITGVRGGGCGGGRMKR